MRVRNWAPGTSKDFFKVTKRKSLSHGATLVCGFIATETLLQMRAK